MSEMVERVARAIADAAALNYDHNKAIFDLYARASIKAYESFKKPDPKRRCVDLVEDWIERDQPTYKIYGSIIGLTGARTGQLLVRGIEAIFNSKSHRFYQRGLITHEQDVAALVRDYPEDAIEPWEMGLDDFYNIMKRRPAFGPKRA